MAQSIAVEFLCPNDALVYYYTIFCRATCRLRSMRKVFKMRVLIVIPRDPACERPDFNYLFPIGLACISAALKATGHAVTCLNPYHQSGTITQQLQALRTGGQTYDVACTGGLSVEYRQVQAVVEVVRATGLAPLVILGGGLISSEPELMFNALKPDYVVLGEGEETIQELLDVLARHADPATVSGIGYRQADGRFVTTTARAPIMDLDAIPWPDFDGFGYAEYLDHLKPNGHGVDLFDKPRVYPLVTSRSCPYLCTFCFHPLGNKYRQRSIDSVMQELEDRIPRHRINTIFTYDELFSRDAKRVYEFCERITALRQKTPWNIVWGCLMRVDGLDEALLATMKKAGCYMVGYGFESYNADVLKSMRKHITPDQIDRAITITLRQNLGIQANFIFGDRAETLATARQTLDYWKAHIHAGIQLCFISPYPGTALYKYCVEKGIIKDRLDFIENHIRDIFNMTESLSDREFAALRFEVFACQMRQSAGVTPTALIRQPDGVCQLTIVCPHCGETSQYGNYPSPPAVFSFFLFCRKCGLRFFVASRWWKVFARMVIVLNAILPSTVAAELLGVATRWWRWFLRVRTRAASAMLK